MERKITDFFAKRHEETVNPAKKVKLDKENTKDEHYPVFDSVEKIRQKVSPIASSGKSSESEPRIDNWYSTLFDEPEGKIFFSRFCDKVYKQNTARDKHEKLGHEFERGYYGEKIQNRSVSSVKDKFKQWAPSLPDDWRRTDLKIGIFHEDPILNQTLLSFHVETLTDSVSFADIMKTSNKNAKTLSEWKRHGQSKGHLVPVESCRYSLKCVEESFNQINLNPQEGKLNSIAWRGKEDHARILANYGDVCVFNGVVLPVGDDALKEKNEVFKIPLYWWSVIILEKTNGEVMYDSFLFRNEKSDESFWKCRCSLQRLQDVTGLDFFKDCPLQMRSIPTYGRRLDFEKICKQKPYLCGINECIERFGHTKSLQRHRVYHSDPDRFYAARKRHMEQTQINDRNRRM